MENASRKFIIHHVPVILCFLALGVFVAFVRVTDATFLILPLFPAVIYHLLSFGFGAAVWRGIWPSATLDGEGWLWGWALGLGLFGMGQFLLAQLGLFSKVGAIWVVAAGLLGWMSVRRAFFSAETARSVAALFADRWSLAALGLWLPVLFFCAAPPSFYDTMAQHLGLPMQYLAWGGAVFTPYYCHTASPLLAELSLSPLLALTGDPVAMNLAHGLTFGLLVLTVGVGAERHVEKGSGAVAAAIFVAMPVAFFCGVAMKPDIFTALFEWLALLAFLRLLEGEAGSRERLRLGLWLGLTLGFALGTKFFALGFAAVLFGLLLVVPAWRRRVGFASLIAGGTALLVVGGVFYLVNWIRLGNPIFPFAAGVFGGPEWADRTAALFDGQRHCFRSLEDWLGLWRLPFSLTFEIDDGTMNNMPGPLPLLLLPWLLVLPGKNRPLRVLFLVVALLLPSWLTSHIAVRYLPALWLLGATGAAVAFRRLSLTAFSDRTRPLLGALLAVLLVLCLLFSFRANDVLLKQSSRYLFGEITQNEFLTQALTPYGAYRFANTKLPQTAVLFLVSDSRFAYLERRAIISGVWDRPPIDDLVLHSADSAAILAEMKRQGATHYLLHKGAFTRLRQTFGWLKWTPDQQKHYDDFLVALGKPLYEDTHATLYALP